MKSSIQLITMYTSRHYNPRYITTAAFILAGYVHITPKGNVVATTQGGSNAIFRMLASKSAARYFGIPAHGRTRANPDLVHAVAERIDSFGIESIREMVAGMQCGNIEEPIPVTFIRQ